MSIIICLKCPFLSSKVGILFPNFCRNSGSLLLFVSSMQTAFPHEFQIQK
ncbi:hypothetical protein QQA_2018 [Clostridioides difficile Y343]|nr:hypothetical protein QQA_2018 [Clostridioides difficile Y343]